MKHLNINNLISKRNQYKNILNANNYNKISSSINYSSRWDDKYESESNEGSWKFELESISFIQEANAPYLSRIINDSKYL